LNASTSGNSCYVLPQWQNFSVAASFRELSSAPTGLIRTHSVERGLLDFEADWEMFQQTRSPFLASDLMSSAIALGLFDKARELAVIVEKHSIVGDVAINLSRLISRKSDVISNGRELKQFHALIADQKKMLSAHPRDAIIWVERALNYAVIGQKDQAKRSILIALELAPTDRYVVRSAVRFFVHVNCWEEAFFYARRAFLSVQDPWIAAPFLSVGTQLGKMPSPVKNILRNAMSSSDHFYYSELLEAYGTMEILNGAEVRARRIFKKAWLEPAKTVVSHSQWILKEKLPGLAGNLQIDFRQSAQAMSSILLSRMDLDGAVSNARVWMFEEPYSVAPYMQISSALFLQEKYTDALSVIFEGLIANPKSKDLINNGAFAALRANDASSEKLIKMLKPLLDWEKDIAPLATYGLFLMRSGSAIEGRLYYFSAIQNAIKSGNRRLAVAATVNFIISEIDVGLKIDPKTLGILARAYKGEQDASALRIAIILKKRIVIILRTNTEADFVEAANRYISSIDAELRIFQSSYAGISGLNFPTQPVDLALDTLSEISVGLAIEENMGRLNQMRLTSHS